MGQNRQRCSMKDETPETLKISVGDSVAAHDWTNDDLILRLRSSEHDFVERKSSRDQGGWLRTAVAFANSTPLNYPAILFVGVDDSGNPQQNAEHLEDLMKSVTGTLEKAYPPI